MGYFQKFKDTSGQYRFRLKAGNNETILSSEAYTSTSGRDNGIASVQTNSQIDSRYADRSSSRGEPYFVLKAANGEVIGVSEMYSSEAARDNGKKSVKINGDTTDIREVS